MITCNKSYSIAVTGVGCVDDGTPTPATLVEPGDGPMGTAVLAPPAIVQGLPHEISFSPPFQNQVSMGRYNIYYLNGFITLNTFVPPVPNGPAGFYIDNYITGGFSLSGPISAGVILVGGGVVANIIGRACNSSSTPPCDTIQLQADTVASNPVSRFVNDYSLPWNFFLGTSDTVSPTTIIDPVTPVELITFLSLSDVYHNSGAGFINYQLNQLEKFPIPIKRCRIKNYESSVKPFWVQGGTCEILDDGSGLPEWEGNFSVLKARYPTNNQDQTLKYFQPGSNVDGPFSRNPVLAINGKALTNDTFYNSNIVYRSIAGVGSWELYINMYAAATFLQTIWAGRKTTGKTPVGEYTLVPGSSCLSDPASVCVEAY